MIKKISAITSVFFVLSLSTFYSCQKEESGTTTSPEILFTMPSEETTHEGTWLSWPHQYQFGLTYRNRLDATWVEMTQALISGEKVHLIAYDNTEEARIIGLLNSAGINMANIDFKIYKTDDVWARDGGPIYVRNKNGDLVIEDWGFNGWGNKYDYLNCDKIPTVIGAIQGTTVIDLNASMILEGGAIEIDGNGTLMATKSAILNNNRNPGMTQIEAERILTTYYGVTNFIWLDGVAGLEVTDMHIDGFAKFVNQNTLVTMNQTDLLNWDVPKSDIDKLYASKNKDGIAYTIITIPLTQSNVSTTYGENLGYKGSYANFYIANDAILVPNYNDPNDAIANGIIQNLFPDRTVVGIDVRNLYANGGMVHCVTQQQPQ